MTGRSLTFAALVACAVSSPLSAQTQQCSTQAVPLRDACQMGTDIFEMLIPQVQGALAGGGPILGSARAVRGVSIGLRVNAVDGRVPDLGAVTLSTTGIVRRNVPTTRTPVPAPALDVGIALFPGISVGLQRILSIDGLVNVAYIPNREFGDFRVKAENGSLKLGYGAKIGILQDRTLMPAVAVSYFRRQLPTSTFSTSFNSSIAGVTTNDSLSLAQMSVRNDAIRIALSKKLGFIEIGGGVGQDRYRTFAQLLARVSSGVGVAANGAAVLTQEITRNAAYGSFALNIFKLRLGAEAGATFGGDSLTTYNTFTDGKLNERRLFGSVGLRVGF